MLVIWKYFPYRYKPPTRILAMLHIKSLAVAALFCTLAAQPSSGQTAGTRPWQHLNAPTLAEVRATWKAPTPEYEPEPYYGWNGHVTLESVSKDLNTMKQLGFRAVTVQYGYGSTVGYMSPEYLAFIRQFVAEVKKRDMRIWIVDDAGYPSGFAGGRFTSDYPELRMQALVVTQQKKVSAGETFDAEVHSTAVSVTALNRDGGSSVQIPVTAGRAKWTAPAGEWTVFVVEHGFRTSPTRSDTNPKRVKDGSQSLEDYLNPEATAKYLATTHELYKQAVGKDFGKTILGFRGDEPDYSIAGLPWTPEFFAAFQVKKGYDVRPYVAALLQPRSAVLTQREQLAKADYYDIFADLFRDGFFKPQADWCAANGLEYQVHLNHEELELELTRSEGDFFRDMRYVQVPGVDSIWHQIWTDTVSDFPRLASSAAHVYGHPRSFTESFAAYRPAPDVKMARYILNEQFVRGINLVETMYYPAAVDGKGGPSELMRDPAYPALMQYSSRLSFLMSQGHPAAEVALLLPSSSLWMGNVKTDDAFVSSERLLSEHQVDFDVVDEDSIDHLLPLEKGAFVSMSGNRYRTLIVPSAAMLSTKMLNRLRAFSKAGGKTVFLGGTPNLIASGNSLSARPAAAEEFSWATVIPVDLLKVPTPPAQPPAVAPGPMEVPAEVWTGLQKALPVQPLTTEANSALRVARRDWNDASALLLFAESDQPFHQEVTVHRKGAKSAELWNVEAGTGRKVATKATAGGLQIQVDLPAYGTEVLVVY